MRLEPQVMRILCKGLLCAVFAVLFLLVTNTAPVTAQETTEQGTEAQEINWTGPYVGVGGGVSWTDFDVDTDISGSEKHRKRLCFEYYSYKKKKKKVICYPPDRHWRYRRPKSFSDSFSINEEQTNFFGTIQLGFDQQINNFFVIGAFVDADKYFGSSENFTAVNTGPHGLTTALKGTFDLDYSATIGTRFGVLINPTTLIYGLVGYTYLKVDGDLSYMFNSKHGMHNVNFAMPDDFEGVTVGGGLQTKISPTTSFKFEYRYTNFESESASSSFQSMTDTRKDLYYGFYKQTQQMISGTANTEIETDMHSIRAVLVFQIPPLAAP